MFGRLDSFSSLPSHPFLSFAWSSFHRGSKSAVEDWRGTSNVTQDAREKVTRKSRVWSHHSPDRVESGLTWVCLQVDRTGGTVELVPRNVSLPFSGARACTDICLGFGAANFDVRLCDTRDDLHGCDEMDV